MFYGKGIDHPRVGLVSLGLLGETKKVKGKEGAIEEPPGRVEREAVGLN